MDKLEQRLRDDAEHIRAEVSPEMQARIEAALRAAEPVRPVPTTRQPVATLWWASSLTGLAAAVLLIVLLNWNAPETERVEPLADTTVPGLVAEMPYRFPLHAETAELTEPLEAELEHLQQDLEKARRNVERDLNFTF